MVWSTTLPGTRSAPAIRCVSWLTRSYTGEDQGPVLRRPARAARQPRRGPRRAAGGDDRGGNPCIAAVARRRLAERARPGQGGAHRGEPGDGGRDHRGALRRRGRFLSPGDRRLAMVRVQAEDFDAGAEIAALRRGNPKIGAVASFIGIARDVNDGDAVSTLVLEHYPEMTEKALEGIVAEARGRWDVMEILVVHR